MRERVNREPGSADYLSPRLETHSTRVARKLADRLVSETGASLTVRDLTRRPLAHIDDSFAVARNTPPDLLTSAQNPCCRPPMNCCGSSSLPIL